MADLTIQQVFDRALGNHQAGRLHDAERLYRRILAQQPQHFGALHYLGVLANQVGRREIAVDLIRRAIAIDPNSPEVHNNLGIALKDSGQLDEAIAAYRQAMALRPNYAEAYSNLGNALKDKGQFDEAIGAYRQAIMLRPNLAEVHYDLAVALREKGQLDDAVASYRQAIRLKPDYAGAHFNLGLALLSRGDWEKGWLEHEWRWNVRGKPPPRPFSQPWWRGEEPKGQIILLHAEQGFGDTIQVLRYAPLLADRGATVILEIQPELRNVARQLAGVSCLVERGQPLPPFDLHCPVFSLPLAFKTTLQSIPGQVPYLFPEPQRVESWRKKLAASASGLRVALSWAGKPNFKGDRRRSISLDRLAPLAEVSGVTFYGLQKGVAETQADQPPAGMQLVNLAPQLDDFTDTAAVMCLMDLVITTDSTVAHLAGALGRPVWVMLQFMPDWRWLLDRQDNPWYPTMRLFRQQTCGDWDTVIRRIVAELADLTRVATVGGVNHVLLKS